MQVYQVHIRVGNQRVAISEVLVSHSEAERIRDQTHPSLNPIVAVWKV